MELLHTTTPNPILIEFGPFTVYWYGVLIVTGILLATFIAMRLARRYGLGRDTVVDAAFWLIICGLAGARLYHVFLEFAYYLRHPWEIFMVWQGGLAIHGAVFAGLAFLWFYTKSNKIDFWKLSAIIAPGLALGQALGRWGNYFNQEVFGRPTDAAWGIPIEIMHRPAEFMASRFFHPTFLYESAGSLLIFTVLMLFHYHIINKQKAEKREYFQYLVFTYLIMYSALRFCLEFIRIDPTPEILGLRLPQIVSLGIIAIIIFYLIKTYFNNNKSTEEA